MRHDQQISSDEQEPVKQTFCRSLRRDTHWKCFLLSLLIYGCLGAIAWCRISMVRNEDTYAIKFPYYTNTHSRSRASPCEDGYIYIPVAFVVMLYLVYLVECWHCHTRVALHSHVDISSVYERMYQMREAPPMVWWKAICYHYVRRSRQVTRYRNGDAFTSTQVYYERVNSHNASSAFNFANCGVKDISKTLVNLEKFPTTKVRFTKGFSFLNIEAEQEFEDQRVMFFHDHERIDDYMETREGLDLANVTFKDYMVAFSDPSHLPWYMSHFVFWLMSFLLLSWPLRVLIEYKTAYVHYHIHKLFGSNYAGPNDPQTHISRVSTMCSSEFEVNVRNNNTIVPSYSEALLMDSTLSNVCQDNDVSASTSFQSGGNGNGFSTARTKIKRIGRIPISRSHGQIRTGIILSEVTTNSRSNCAQSTSDYTLGNETDPLTQNKRHRKRRKRNSYSEYGSVPLRSDSDNTLGNRATRPRSTDMPSTPESPTNSNINQTTRNKGQHKTQQNQLPGAISEESTSNDTLSRSKNTNDNPIESEQSSTGASNINGATGKLRTAKDLIPLPKVRSIDEIDEPTDSACGHHSCSGVVHTCPYHSERLFRDKRGVLRLTNDVDIPVPHSIVHGYEPRREIPRRTRTHHTVGTASYLPSSCIMTRVNSGPILHGAPPPPPITNHNIASQSIRLLNTVESPPNYESVISMNTPVGASSWQSREGQESLESIAEPPLRLMETSL